MNKAKDSRSGTAMTVLEITNVIAKSVAQGTGADTDASDFLQQAGFTGLKGLQTAGMSARVPGGNEIFLLEYDSGIKANQKPFRLLSISSEVGEKIGKEIETGYTIYLQDVAGLGGSIQVTCRGDTLISWEFQCKKADEDTVNVYRALIGRNAILPRNARPPARLREDRVEKVETSPPGFLPDGGKTSDGPVAATLQEAFSRGGPVSDLNEETAEPPVLRKKKEKIVSKPRQKEEGVTMNNSLSKKVIDLIMQEACKLCQITVPEFKDSAKKRGNYSRARALFGWVLKEDLADEYGLSMTDGARVLDLSNSGAIYGFVNVAKRLIKDKADGTFKSDLECICATVRRTIPPPKPMGEPAEPEETARPAPHRGHKPLGKAGNDTTTTNGLSFDDMSVYTLNQLDIAPRDLAEAFGVEEGHIYEAIGRVTVHLREGSVRICAAIRKAAESLR